MDHVLTVVIHVLIAAAHHLHVTLLQCCLDLAFRPTRIVCCVTAFLNVLNQLFLREAAEVTAKAAVEHLGDVLAEAATCGAFMEIVIKNSKSSQVSVGNMNTNAVAQGTTFFLHFF